MATPHESSTVPVPLEQYAHGFDDLFHTSIQCRRFREYLAGLLLPRDRNKALTALVGAEPITQAQTAPVQQLQFFLTEADWDTEAVTARRIAGLRADPLTTPHAEGALVIDETGDRKDGTHTAHVGYHYLGSIGKLGNGIVAVTSLWHDDAQPPGAWTAVVRRFHDGHEETWWALDLRLGSYAPEYPTRLVVATSDPRTLPAASTWYLVTNLPLPQTRRAAEHPAVPAAELAEVVRLYGLRQWVEQGYKQVKQELGWADCQVRSDH